MKKALYFDCPSGISGNMTIGALIDLGVDKQAFLDELNKLNLDGYELIFERREKLGIYGTYFNVILEGGHKHHHNANGHSHSHGNEHDHSHHHEQEDFSDNHVHEHNHHGDHVHRNLYDIEHIIDNSGLNDNVKLLSKKIFNNVAVAEAKIHNKSIEEVHFHEVGAIDSIVDIVGSAICIDMLDVDKIYCSPINVGGGFVKCSHGKLPVPAPATLEILKGIPIYSSEVRSELTTPTGAAIIKAIAEKFTDLPQMIIEEVGYGLGTKDLVICNALRVYSGYIK